MILYCLGFIFDIEKSTVMLLPKKKGVHKGKWNGIGGHLEEGETGLDAIVRECYEEARILTMTNDWVPVGEITELRLEPRWGLLVYAATIHSRAVPVLEDINNIKEFDSEGDEEVYRVKLEDIHKLKTAPHTTSLIHYCLEKLRNLKRPLITIYEDSPQAGRYPKTGPAVP